MLFDFDSNLTIYLVDTENVGSSWASVLNTDGGRLHIYLFVTENAKNLNYTTLSKVLENKNRYHFETIECQTGKNSLDFHLSSYLGYLVSKYPKANFVILSADTGYDTLMEFWKKKGVQLSRLNTKPEVEKPVKKPRIIKEKISKPVKKEGSVKPKKEPVKETVKKETVKPVFVSRHDLIKNVITQDEETSVKVENILNQHTAEDKNKIYIDFVSTFGKNQGLAYYKDIKKVLNNYYSLDIPQA